MIKSNADAQVLVKTQEETTNLISDKTHNYVCTGNISVCEDLSVGTEFYEEVPCQVCDRDYSDGQSQWKWLESACIKDAESRPVSESVDISNSQNKHQAQEISQSEEDNKIAKMVLDASGRNLRVECMAWDKNNALEIQPSNCDPDLVKPLRICLRKRSKDRNSIKGEEDLKVDGLASYRVKKGRYSPKKHSSCNKKVAQCRETVGGLCTTSGVSSDQQHDLLIQLQTELLEALRQKEDAFKQIQKLKDKLKTSENKVKQLTRKLKSHEESGVNLPLKECRTATNSSKISHGPDDEGLPLQPSMGSRVHVSPIAQDKVDFDAIECKEEQACDDGDDLPPNICGVNVDMSSVICRDDSDPDQTTDNPKSLTDVINRKTTVTDNNSDIDKSNVISNSKPKERKTSARCKKKEKVPTLQCSFCPKLFINNCRLQQHTRLHTGEKPYQCTKCERSFRLAFQLNQHIRTHQEVRPYCCSVCGKGFGVSSVLYRHMLTHTGEKTYQCPVCPKAFTQSAHLTQHSRTHTGLKPFNCSVCQKGFKQKAHVIQHTRIHTGERPFQCLTCDRTFSDSSHLTRHTRTHTGERPHQCFVCMKAFSDRTYLNRHMKTHSQEKPHKCCLCNKGFNVRYNLTQHMKTHRGLLEKEGSLHL